MFSKLTGPVRLAQWGSGHSFDYWALRNLSIFNGYLGRFRYHDAEELQW